MTSGIYKLTFDDGTFYIGKSIDVEKRWEQHYNDLKRGKHSKKMQEAYRVNGTMPIAKLLMEAHPDHIDILETIFVQSSLGPLSLNTAGTVHVEADDLDLFDNCNPKVWQISTFEHIRVINYLHDEVDKLQAQIDSDKGVHQLKRQVEYFKKLAVDNQIEVQKYKNRGFLARLFNF